MTLTELIILIRNGNNANQGAIFVGIGGHAMTFIGQRLHNFIAIISTITWAD